MEGYQAIVIAAASGVMSSLAAITAIKVDINCSGLGVFGCF